MRVLLTGHNGYIGSVLTQLLLEAGHDVVGLDTFFFEHCSLTDAPQQVQALRMDVRDVTAVDLVGFDAVIHLAALCNDPLGSLNPNLTYEINHHASIRLALAAKQAGVSRFLFASSCSMYGASGDENLTEEGELRPLTAYAESKVRTEHDLHALANPGFSPTYLRNATVYGASPRLRADVVLNNLVGWAHATSCIRVLSDGTPWRPIVHVRDLSQVFLLLLSAPREIVHDQAFNVGADTENYQVRDLVKVVSSAVSGCRVEYAEGGGPDPRSYRVSFAKLRTTFPSWKPRWNAASGARELLQAYQDAGVMLDDIIGKRFTRLKKIQELLDDHRLDARLRWSDANVHA